MDTRQDLPITATAHSRTCIASVGDGDRAVDETGM